MAEVESRELIQVSLDEDVSQVPGVLTRRREKNPMRYPIRHPSMRTFVARDTATSSFLVFANQAEAASKGLAISRRGYSPGREEEKFST